MATILKSFAISGVDAFVVDVEVKAIYGQPMIFIVGLGDTSIKESKERVEAAIRDSNYKFPEKKIVINLAPSNLKKAGSHFDLSIAIGLIIETGQIEIDEINEYAFIGELSLNAKVRECKGVLPMVIAAKKAKIKRIIVPIKNLNEASLIKGVQVL